MNVEALRELDSTADILAALDNLIIAMRRRILALEAQLPIEFVDVPEDRLLRRLSDMGLDPAKIEHMTDLNTLRTALCAVHRGVLTAKGKRNGSGNV